MDPAPDAFIQAFMLHRTLFHDDSDNEDSHEEIMKTILELAIFSSQVACALATTRAPGRAAAYARAVDSLKRCASHAQKALRQAVRAEEEEDAGDVGEGGDRENVRMADGTDHEYAEDGAQDTLAMPERTDKDLAPDVCTEKVESSIVPALNLRVHGHTKAQVLPGIQDRDDAYVNAHVDKYILPNLDERVQRRVDERVDELFKSTLLSQGHPYHDAFFALLLPRLAALQTPGAAPVPLPIAQPGDKDQRASCSTEAIVLDSEIKRSPSPAFGRLGIMAEPYSEHHVRLESGEIRVLKRRCLTKAKKP
ncbi:hypothetical protein OH76DRAFT_1404043 [Lentinus brumalis]|uniref:Uncharacterized protein n=1 Tax=Lentinus brumalis TaxID=2498619 RepID=A0A371D9D5_9APHY|nr:hypothetical protein OH76DRAFT_1404043 [Polyporus brumalis]